MNYQQILALLQAKFAGVRKDGLAQLARMIALQVTSQEEAQSLIDKLDVEKVNETVKEYRKDVDKEVSEANKTYEGNLKKKFKFVELENPTPADDSTKKTDPNDLQAAIKAAFAEVVKPLNDEIAVACSITAFNCSLPCPFTEENGITCTPVPRFGSSVPSSSSLFLY